MRMVSWRVKRRVASCLTYYFDTFNQAPTGTNVTTVLLWMSVGLCTASEETVAVLVISIVLLFWFDTVPHDLFVSFFVGFFLYLCLLLEKKKKKKGGVQLRGVWVGVGGCFLYYSVCKYIFSGSFQFFFFFFFTTQLASVGLWICLKSSNAAKRRQSSSQICSFLLQTAANPHAPATHISCFTAPDTYHASGRKRPGLLCLSFLMLSAIWSVSWMSCRACMDVMRKKKKYCEEYFF